MGSVVFDLFIMLFGRTSHSLMHYRNMLTDAHKSSEIYSPIYTHTHQSFFINTPAMQYRCGGSSKCSLRCLKALLLSYKSPGMKQEGGGGGSSTDHMSWHKPSHVTNPAPALRSSPRRVWKETRVELMCLDVSSSAPPSAPSRMKRLPIFSRVTLETTRSASSPVPSPER